MSDVSKEYAKALFMLAVESEKEGDYKKALDLVSNVFSENPQYIQFLLSPGVPLSERLDALEKAFSQAVPIEVLSFIKLLCEKRHIDYFNQCVEEYKNLYNQISKISYASVVSAVELNEKEKMALKEKLENMSGHTVLLECSVDSTILGGLIVEIDGKVIDASIQRHLKNVKDVIDK